LLEKEKDKLYWNSLENLEGSRRLEISSTE